MVNFKYDWFVQTYFNILSQKTLRPLPSVPFQVQCALAILRPTQCSQCYWQRRSISNRSEQNRMQYIRRSWAERRVISGFRSVSMRPSDQCQWDLSISVSETFRSVSLRPSDQCQWDLSISVVNETFRSVSMRPSDQCQWDLSISVNETFRSVSMRPFDQCQWDLPISVNETLRSVSVRPSDQCRWDFRSSGVLRRVRLVVTGVSGQAVGPVFMHIRPVGTELFLADGRTGMTKLTVTFRNFANAPKHDTKRNRNKTRLETCGPVVF